MPEALKKILCIEDDRETAALIAEELIDRGYAVTLAHDGREGIAAILKTFLGAALVWEVARLVSKPLLAGWIGLVVVVQNIVGSLFNSHIFDFTQGWTYVVGMGVAGGMVIGNQRSEIRSQPSSIGQ